MHVWIEILLGAAILAGIRLMSKPETAVQGNRLTALSLLTAVLLLLWRDNILPQPILLAALATGAALGLVLALRVT
ncbi:MAG TPA: NADP transhydrogenase subunit beta, partial [Candidatus Hydrogenedentes bacterium]|nr:NADP transhydrogenase subunit beta [Candidatus Hydrogenedentota bacterium]